MGDLWMAAGEGPKWMSVLNSAEAARGFPVNLLARMAFEESSFRLGVIAGVVPSSEGALGIMQLLPQFFASARAAVPFTAYDTAAQIKEAATLLSSLYARFGDWQEAVAAYNWGGGNLHHSYVEHGQYALADMPEQTQKYVREIFADVPVVGALLPNLPQSSVT
jgi:soluble lytic murein transglycosylase-like protein